MTGCLLKIKEAFNDLKPSEKKVADFILNNTDEVIGMSIGELAEKSGTSKAAVIRLCKALEFSGYRDLAISIASTAPSLKVEENEYIDIKAGDDLETIIKNVSLNNKRSIEDTLQVLDGDEVRKAVNLIHKTKRVDFYGVGASGIIALDAQQKFMRINKYASAYTDPHLQATAAANLSTDDVAVIISYSGETKDVIETMEIAKRSGATVISITKYGKNTLSQAADIRLFLSTPETSMRSGAMGSRIAQLNLIDIIFSGVASLEYPHIKKYLDRTHTVTSRKKFKK